MFQECTNSRHQVAMVTRCYNDSPSRVLDLLRVTILMPRIVKWLLDFFGNVSTPDVCYVSWH